MLGISGMRAREEIKVDIGKDRGRYVLKRYIGLSIPGAHKVITLANSKQKRTES